MIYFEGEPKGVRMRVSENKLQIHNELLSPQEAFRLTRELQMALFVWNELNGAVRR